MLNLYVIPENWRRDFDFQYCDSLFGRVCEHLLCCCAFLRLDTIAHIMSTLGHSSPSIERKPMRCGVLSHP